MSEIIPADFWRVPPAIEAARLVWRVWCEGFEGWNGEASYFDVDTARQHAAVDYIDEAYGWNPEKHSVMEAPEVTLTWEIIDGWWTLIADGTSTGVRVAPERIFQVTAPQAGV